jgi:hypothetical protein
VEATPHPAIRANTYDARRIWLWALTAPSVHWSKTGSLFDSCPRRGRAATARRYAAKTVESVIASGSMPPCPAGLKFNPIAATRCSKAQSAGTRPPSGSSNGTLSALKKAYGMQERRRHARNTVWGCTSWLRQALTAPKAEHERPQLLDKHEAPVGARWQCLPMRIARKRSRAVRARRSAAASADLWRSVFSSSGYDPPYPASWKSNSVVHTSYVPHIIWVPYICYVNHTR